MIFMGDVESACGKLETLRQQGITEESSRQIPPMNAMVQSLTAACNSERQNTPFFAPTDPNAGNKLVSHTRTNVFGTGADAACRALESRSQMYGPVDPVPAVRKALIEKCEAYQQSRGAGVAASEPGTVSGLDTKTKIAIGAGALLLAVIVAKKMKKR